MDAIFKLSNNRDTDELLYDSTQAHLGSAVPVLRYINNHLEKYRNIGCSISIVYHPRVFDGELPF